MRLPPRSRTRRALAPQRRGCFPGHQAHPPWAAPGLTGGSGQPSGFSQACLPRPASVGEEGADSLPLLKEELPHNCLGTHPGVRFSALVQTFQPRRKISVCFVLSLLNSEEVFHLDLRGRRQLNSTLGLRLPLQTLLYEDEIQDLIHGDNDLESNREHTAPSLEMVQKADSETTES